VRSIRNRASSKSWSEFSSKKSINFFGIRSKEINRARGAEGAVWRREYFDRSIRDEAHFQHALEYIENNPVAAGFVVRPDDWRCSSAYRS
jgi:putative transposase